VKLLTRQGWTIAALAVAVMLVGSACGTTQEQAQEQRRGRQSSVTLAPPDEPPRPGGKLVYGLSGETDGWHPGTSRWAPSGVQVSHSFFDTLTAYDDDLEVKPFLAEAFDHNEDYTQWTIRMRPGVEFHDGTPADAAAVKANIDWHRKSSLTSVPFALVDDTVVVDDLSVRVDLSETWVTLPNAFATQVGVLAAPSMLDDPEGSRHPVGTGPFVFDEWTPDAKLVVKKNDHYWQGGYPLLDEIEFRPIPDPVARKSALESGELDIAEITEPQDIIDFTAKAQEGEFQLFTDEKSEVPENLVMLDTAVAPFDDLTARQALAYGTDKDAYIETIGKGLYEPANSPYHRESRWYTDVDYPQFDPAKARELVDQYKREHDGRFEFTLIGTSADRDRRSFLKEMWEPLGVKVSLQDVELGQLVLKVISGDYQSTMWSYFDAPNPVADSIWWICDSAKPPGELALNFARNCDPEMDAAFQQARQTPDLDEQKKYYDIVQERMAEDLPFIWLYHTQSAVVTKPNVWDVTTWRLPDGDVGLPLQSGTHPLFQIWVTEQ
jgi:peptide/nickel transport system substrate-binding protein